MVAVAVAMAAMRALQIVTAQTRPKGTCTCEQVRPLNLRLSLMIQAPYYVLAFVVQLSYHPLHTKGWSVTARFLGYAEACAWMPTLNTEDQSPARQRPKQQVLKH